MNSKWISLALSILGIGGVAATSWLSIRCHERAKDKKTKKEKILAFGPAIGSGIATSACILLSRHVDRKEIVALTASCAYMTANRDKIEAKARQLLGEEEFKKIKTETAKEIMAEHKNDAKHIIEETGYGNIRFVETMFGREFRSDLAHVEWAEKHLNYLFCQGDRVNYNTLYELFGLKKDINGWMYGWPDNLDIYGYSLDTPIYFENYKSMDEETGEECWIIDCRSTPPIQNYLDYERA